MNILNQENNRPIAFFDSGVGGLTVFSKLKKLLPNENYLYMGDTKNMPYGEKSKEELVYFADLIFKFFEKKGAKAVVMACNTTSAAAYEELKNNYNFKIYPIIQSCAKVISKFSIERLGVFATPATIKSGVYEKEIAKYNSQMKVFSQDCPEWVKIVEEKRENESESLPLIEKYLMKMLVNKPKKIILGCTHYPYLINLLSEFAPRELFIDPSVYFAEFIKNDLKISNLLNVSHDEVYEKFYVSSNPEGFKNAASMFYKLSDMPELIDVCK